MMPKNYLLRFGLIACLAVSVRWNACAAELSVEPSDGFIKAVKYGFSYTLLTSSQLNYWNDRENSDASKITEKVHAKLGQRIKVNVLGSKLDDGTTRLSVEFPDFEVGHSKFILDFWKANGAYEFLGYSVDFVTYQFDTKTNGVEVELPTDFRSVVVGDFALSNGDVKQIQSWFEEFLTDTSPKSKSQASHIFLAPFSKAYSTSFRVYWVEGKQVLEFDRSWMKDHPGVAKWSVRMDYSEPAVAHPEPSAEVTVLHSTNFELATCVRDGLLISVGP